MQDIRKVRAHMGMEPEILHNPFCSAAGYPCPLRCWEWPLCAAEMFPRLANACPDLCPVHGSPESQASLIV
jgi:hypothetical protein